MKIRELITVLERIEGAYGLDVDILIDNGDTGEICYSYLCREYMSLIEFNFRGGGSEYGLYLGPRLNEDITSSQITSIDLDPFFKGE